MNFSYLNSIPDLAKLYEYCAEAEEFALSKPNISATSARKAMEYLVKLIYHSLVGQDYGFTVFEMITDARFEQYVNNADLISAIHYIRKMGNVAVHDGNLTADEAAGVLKELHFLVGEFCILLGEIKGYPAFVKPTAAAPARPAPEKREKAGKIEKIEVTPEVAARLAPRLRQARFDVALGRDESENKKLFLAACLREAGWPLASRENQAMPGCAGLPMLLEDGDSVDYILYGRDNKPLAVIEYTATARNLVEGRAKGLEKADKLAAKLGYKPIVYYTEGYHIYVIDQLGYPPRRVFQFHTVEELELLKLRSTIRGDISAPVIDPEIAGRPYQRQAIAAACAAFARNRRRSLLVMATGTGKTRVSIALVKILTEANWAKNILFLADRTSLVRQAHKNFNKLLPVATTSIYAGGSDRDPNARIIFSTYQTMINLINEDSREFGIGRFDLIIIDEAHRSIFRKYSALFHYFDALMMGLTATPRSEDNRNTYEMFQLKNGVPDYAYELEQAVEDKFLVGFTVLDRTTDALRRGIHYDELSPEERERFEDAFAAGDGGEGGSLEGSVLDAESLRGDRYVNLGTIDAMLGDLMKNGLKISGGDTLGKTIIFASSHFEAEKIVERFQQLYPYLGLDFCKLIDSRVPDNQSLIDSFGERGQLPQVVASVDMMDTGIDVPDVLNLVFFKRVNSKIKFLQMVGRGTRLSPDVFGPGLDKQGFLIFDYYDNFSFFRARNTWTAAGGEGERGWNVTPQSVLIDRRRLGILRNLIEKENRSPFEEDYMLRLKAHFVSGVQGLCNDDIEVQYNMAFVSKYRTAEQWDGFTDGKLREIEKHILPLLPRERDPVKVKTFDLLLYAVEEEVPRRLAENKDIRMIRYGFGGVSGKLDSMLAQLWKLKTIPAVVRKEELIQKMRHADYLFDRFSLERCEQVRLELRELMAYIPDDKTYYVIDVKDFVIDVSAGEAQVGGEQSYAEKALAYIEKGSPALAKLRDLDELTQQEKEELETAFKASLGSESDYAAWSGGKALLPFLRTQTGIADRAIQVKFGSLWKEGALNDLQRSYVEQIISYTRENGDITFLDLQRVSPFCDTDVTELFGDRIGYIKDLINGLHRPVM